MMSCVFLLRLRRRDSLSGLMAPPTTGQKQRCPLCQPIRRTALLFSGMLQARDTFSHPSSVTSPYPTSASTKVTTLFICIFCLLVWNDIVVFTSSHLIPITATAPPAPASFAFDLAQVAEQHVELRWSDLSFLNSRHSSTFEVFLQYQEEEESLQGVADRGVKKFARVPISLSSRGVTVAGLSPGSVYTFTLRAFHPSGATWSLGQTRTAYTSESPDSHFINMELL